MRRVAARLGLAAFGLAVSLLALEAGLRLFWCDSAAASYEYQSGPFLSQIPYLGTWHIPNTLVEHRRSCFDVHYRTNEWGMKGDPVRPHARRIALLGDSFIEGFGHASETTAGHFLEEELGSDFQVLNFGVSFFKSTIDELVIYDNLAKFFDPEVVILFFLNYNDLEDLLNRDKLLLIDANLHFVYPRVGSMEEIAAVVRQKPPAVDVDRPDYRSCLVRFLRFAAFAFAQKAQMALDFRWDFRHELARPYLTQEDADMKRAWSIVEASLGRLGELTRERHQKLLVVSLADPYQLDDRWVRLTALAERKPFSATYPNEKLARICAKLGIRHYDLYPETQAYVAEHHLGYPFLSFRCDRHFDVEGERLIAKLLYQYLEREHLLDAKPSGSPAPQRSS